MNTGDVVIIRSRAYKVVGFTDDGEPRLIRLTVRGVPYVSGV